MDAEHHCRRRRGPRGQPQLLTKMAQIPRVYLYALPVFHRLFHATRRLKNLSFPFRWLVQSGQTASGQAGVVERRGAHKALSARVARAAPNNLEAIKMRARVLGLGRRGLARRGGAQGGGNAHYDRAAALCPAPAGKAELAGIAAWSRSQAEAM